MGIKAAALSSSWTPDVWRFYVDHGFTYVAVADNQFDAALGSWPSDAGTFLEVAFAGGEDRLLRIARGGQKECGRAAQENRVGAFRSMNTASQNRRSSFLLKPVFTCGG